MHAPFDEFVAFDVALEFQLHVQIERPRHVETIDLYRVVHHQIDRHQRLDDLWILAEVLRHAAHGRQIAEQGYAGKLPSQWRRIDSRTMRIETGRRETWPTPTSSKAGSE
jgi:hypothetical protein